MSTALVRPEDRPEPSLMEIIQAVAANPQVDVAKMEALLGLKERMEERDAKRQFNEALARLLPSLPRVSKNGTIRLVKDGVDKGSLPFAKYEDIDAVIRPLESAEGFSRSFTSEPVPNGVVIICTLRHSGGHSETSRMQLPPDPGPGRNALQAIGSSHSYGKRYLTLNIYNIITEGADDDGKAGGAKYISQHQADNIYALLSEIGGTDTQSKFLKTMAVECVEQIPKASFPVAMNLLKAKRSSGK